MNTTTSPPVLARAFRADGLSARQRCLATVLALLVAAALWLPCVHLCFRPPAKVTSAQVRALLAHQLALHKRANSRDLALLRDSNPEWDFMARTFFVLALANLALREPAAQPTYLRQMDALIDETLRLERERGLFFFLMDYAREDRFVTQPPRSLFLDGELALMLAARRFVAEQPRYRDLLRERVELMAARMQAAPLRCAESYPNECWTFCNAIALAAIQMADVLDGTDHSRLRREWLQAATRELRDRSTSLLISSFTLDGTRRDGPEGSSLWLVAHCLQLIDERFAREQYLRAKRELSRSLLGFGYAREWPRSAPGPRDIDSGPVVPLLEASPASSGLALIAAASFGDRAFLDELRTALEFAAFPTTRNDELHYAASNQLGDAVVLYALTLGPLWQRVKEHAR